jgi:hypothetical protein
MTPAGDHGGAGTDLAGARALPVLGQQRVRDERPFVGEAFKGLWPRLSGF